MSDRLLPVLLVGVAVALNVASAVILKEAADLETPTTLVLTAFFALLVLINALRVVLWGSVHRRFPLSDSYPLTSIFFPMILLVSVFYGEDVGAAKLVGTLLITVGVVVMVASEERGGRSAPMQRESDAR